MIDDYMCRLQIRLNINFIFHDKRHLSKFEKLADMSKVCIEFMDQEKQIAV